MKKLIWAMAALSVLAAGPVFATEEGKNSSLFIEKRVERLKERLTLTDEQAAKIREVIKSKSEKMKQLMEQTDAEIAAALSDEQKVKFEEMKREWKEQRGKLGKALEKTAEKTE